MNTTAKVAAMLRSKSVEYATVDRYTARQGRLIPSEIRGDQVTKALLLADAHGYALAVIPVNRRINLTAIEQEFGRRFRLAGQDEVRRVFPGSPPQALPPIGDEPQLETYVEQSLVRLSDVYFETADPRRLLRIDGESFRNLFYGAWCGGISRAEN